MDVYSRLDWNKIASQEDLDNLKCSMGTDPGLVAKVEAAQRELNDPAGLFSTLSNSTAEPKTPGVPWCYQKNLRHHGTPR